MPPKKNDDETLKTGAENGGSGEKQNTGEGLTAEHGLKNADGTSSLPKAPPSGEGQSDGTLEASSQEADVIHNERGGRDALGEFYVTFREVNYYASDMAGAYDLLQQSREKRATPEKREFDALGGVIHNNKFHEPGDPIELTEDEHGELASLGLVDRDWEGGF